MQERLGHANIGMTLIRHSHITPSMRCKATGALDIDMQEAEGNGEAIFGKNNQSDAV